MESDAGCGLLGQPIDQRSSSGCLVCTVTQLFAKVVIDVPAAVVAHWSDHNFESNGAVEFDGNKVSIWGKRGTLSLEAHTWGDLNSEGCAWDLGQDGVLTVSLEKDPSNWGSWPRPFQSLKAAHPSDKADAPPSLQQLCIYNKEEFNKAADEALEAHLEETRALRLAFSQAVSQQLSSAAFGPLGQLAILFPAQGPHCLGFLQRAQHLPTVQKLLSLAQESIGFNLESAVVSIDSVAEQTAADALVSCFLAGLAALEHRRAEHGIASVQCITSVCGWGAGEYAAAVFAGVLRLTDALRVVGAHADALQAGAGPAVAAAAVRRILDDVEIHPPRLRMYSGADAGLYSTSEEVRISLPRRAASSSRPLSSRRWRLVRLALMQQGVAQFIEPVPTEAKERGNIQRTTGSNASELGSVEEGDGFLGYSGSGGVLEMESTF